MTGRTGGTAVSQPQVGGVLDGEAVSLRLGCVGPGSARFTIRSRSGRPAEPSHVDVLGEKIVLVPVVSADYHITIQGPGDLRFELTGSRDGHAAAVDVQVRHTARGLDLELRNDGPREIQLELRSLGHGEHEKRVDIAAGGAQPLGWPTEAGRYDVEVTTPQDTTFHRRITGRAEGIPCCTG